MRPRSWARLLIVAATAFAVAAAALGYVAGSAPAANRDASHGFVADPGPSAITFGKDVAYKAFLANDTGTTFKRVTFTQTIPSVTLSDGSKLLLADLVYSSCEPAGPPYAGLTATSYSCPTIETIPAQSPAIRYDYTFVWKSRSLPAGVTCKTSPCELNTTGTWTIKEGLKNSGLNDTFTTPETTTLLSVPDTGQAGGYALTGCSDPSTSSSVETNQSVSSDNRIATRFCASSSLPGLSADPGVPIVIKERGKKSSDDPRLLTDVSSICAAAPGTSCDDPNGYTPWTFSPAKATVTLIFTTLGLKGNEKIDGVLHDPGSGAVPWQDVTAQCTITPDPSNKLVKAVCPTDVNGQWGGF